MIEDITLTVNGHDFSGRLSTYAVVPETSYTAELISINGTEHRGSKRLRDTVNFSLFPSDPLTVVEDMAVLEGKKLLVSYTDPGSSIVKTDVEMSLTSDLSRIFLLNSSDGKIYYKGTTITLRARRPR